VAELQKALGDKAAVEREKAAAEAAAAEQQRLHELSNNALQQQMQQLSANISSKEALIQQLARNELEARELNQVYQVGVLAGMGGGIASGDAPGGPGGPGGPGDDAALGDSPGDNSGPCPPRWANLHQGEAPTHYGGRWLISLGNVSLHGMMAGGSHFRVAGPCRWPTQTLSPV